MITVGLVHELAFIAAYFEKELVTSVSVDGKEIKAIIDGNKITIEYKGQTIWTEGVYGEGNWFGVESADTVNKITEDIDKHGNTSWKERYRWDHYIETGEEFVGLQTAIDQATYEENLERKKQLTILESMKNVGTK